MSQTQTEAACRSQPALALHLGSKLMSYVKCSPCFEYMASAFGKAPEMHFSPATMHAHI